MDPIANLPPPQEHASSDELEILDSLFKEKEVRREALSEFKESLGATALFLVLSLPFFDGLIKRAIPATETGILLMLAKGVIFFLLFYIISRSYFHK